MKQSGLSRMVEAFKERVRQEYRTRLYLAFGFCQQWYYDQALIAAAEAFDLDPDGVKKFADALRSNVDEFTDIWNADTDDCEYAMVKQDQKLAEVCGEYFTIPYEKRYVMKINDLRRLWETDVH